MEWADLQEELRQKAEIVEKLQQPDREFQQDTGDQGDDLSGLVEITAGNNPVKRQVMCVDALNAVRYDRTHSQRGLETEENTSEEVLELDPG